MNPARSMYPSMMPRIRELPKGSVVLNRYVVERPIGRGACATVYLARHRATDALVAVKVLDQQFAESTEVVARFAREARAAVRIRSDYVVTIHDFDTEADGEPVLVMEYLEGRSVGQMLRKGPMAIAMVRAVGNQLLEGLGAAHEVGVIHRDLKPGNLFLEKRPHGAVRCKILDFGISKVIEGEGQGGNELTKAGELLGTLAYMAPEQARAGLSQVDARADLYAAGVCLFAMITGSKPIQAADSMRMLVAILKQPALTLEQATGTAYPAVLEAFFAKAMAKDPGQRYQTATEMREGWITTCDQAIDNTGAAFWPAKSRTGVGEPGARASMADPLDLLTREDGEDEPAIDVDPTSMGLAKMPEGPADEPSARATTSRYGSIEVDKEAQEVPSVEVAPDAHVEASTPPAVAAHPVVAIANVITQPVTAPTKSVSRRANASRWVGLGAAALGACALIAAVMPRHHAAAAPSHERAAPVARAHSFVPETPAIRPAAPAVRFAEAAPVAPSIAPATEPAAPSSAPAAVAGPTYDSMVADARHARESGELARARTLLHSALVVQPNGVEALSTLASAELDAGQPSAAATQYRRVISARPGNAAAYLGLGEALADQGQMDEAAVALRRCLALHPAGSVASRAHASLAQIAPNVAIAN